MPLLISAYIYTLCSIPLSPYSVMIYYVSKFIDNHMYLYLSIGFPKYIFKMSQYRNLAPVVEMATLKTSFPVVVFAVLVLTKPGKVTRFPLAQAFSGEVCPFEVCNCKQFCHR